MLLVDTHDGGAGARVRSGKLRRFLMSVFMNHERSDRVDREGEKRTHVEESRRRATGRFVEAGYEAHGIDEEVVDQRSVRSLSFSAATVNGLLGIVLLALESVIATRFLLLTFGASRSSGFVRFVFDLSWPFVRPYSSAFRTHSWNQGIIEPASLLAIGVYAIVVAFSMLVVRAVVPEVRERHAVQTVRSTRT
jgi:hypothetical protein